MTNWWQLVAISGELVAISDVLAAISGELVGVGRLLQKKSFHERDPRGRSGRENSAEILAAALSRHYFLMVLGLEGMLGVGVWVGGSLSKAQEAALRRPNRWEAAAHCLLGERLEG